MFHSSWPWGQNLNSKLSWKRRPGSAAEGVPKLGTGREGSEPITPLKVTKFGWFKTLKTLRAAVSVGLFFFSLLKWKSCARLTSRFKNPGPWRVLRAASPPSGRSLKIPSPLASAPVITLTGFPE